MARPGLEFDSKIRRELGHTLIDVIDDYYSSLTTRPVQVAAKFPKNQPDCYAPLPEKGEEPATIIHELCEAFLQQGFHTGSANYFGLMNPTPAYAAVLAELLVAAFNPQLASQARSEFASHMERETLHWIGECLGWCAHEGTFTNGGSEANYTGMMLALAAKSANYTRDGIASLRARPVFYASMEAHHSLDKGAIICGTGRESLRRIPVDESAHIKIDQLQKTIRADLDAGLLPCCVIGTAGTTSSGAIDDLVALSQVSREHNLWYHVDGAYGLATIFSQQHRSLVAGVEEADSIALDPHKWLAMPFSVGVVLTSHQGAMQRIFDVEAPYLRQYTSLAAKDNFRLGLQWSRRMNSLKLWLTLRIHGRQIYEELINCHIRLSRELATWVKQSEQFELIMPPELATLNLTVRLPGATAEEIERANALVVDKIVQDGKFWLSLTHVNGRKVIRCMIISYLSTQSHLQEFQSALAAAAEETIAAATSQ